MNSAVSGVVVDAGEGGTSIIPVVSFQSSSQSSSSSYVIKFIASVIWEEEKEEEDVFMDSRMDLCLELL